MAKLILCQHCERHIRASEVCCPFCQNTVTHTASAPVARGRVPTRAALLIAGAAAAGATTLTACEDDSDDDLQGEENRDPLDKAGQDGGSQDDEMMAQPAYGVPIDPKDAGDDLAQPAYGVPIDPEDGGVPMAQPAYGVPIDPDPDDILLQPAYGVPVDPDPDDILLQPAYGVPVDPN